MVTCLEAPLPRGHVLSRVAPRSVVRPASFLDGSQRLNSDVVAAISRRPAQETPALPIRIVRVLSDGRVAGGEAAESPSSLAFVARKTRWLATQVATTLNLPECRSVHIHSLESAWVVYHSRGGELVGIDGINHNISNRIQRELGS